MVLAAAGQSRSVTNADLERFRQARLKAEADYRENYAKWGFPSPEELDRRREESRVETEKLAEQLRAERLERERLAMEREANEAAARSLYLNQSNGVDYPYESPFFFSSGGGGRFGRRSLRNTQTGYFAGGQFWPTPIVRNIPRPLFVPARK